MSLGQRACRLKKKIEAASIFIIRNRQVCQFEIGGQGRGKQKDSEIPGKVIANAKNFVELRKKIGMIGPSEKKGRLEFFMAKWEYMIRKTDYAALNQTSFADLERVRLTEHGEEGWELVSVTPSQNGECLILFLKRLVEEPPPLPEKKKK